MRNSILSKVRSSIPTYIQETYPKFVDFLMTYYTYMETEGHISELLLFESNIKGLSENPEYIRKFLIDLGFDIGVNLSMDPYLQFKLINDFFSMRGSEPSLKLLFRMLFNEDVHVEYPRDKLLYPSYANYTHNIFLITTAPENTKLPDTSFAGVVGLTSQSTGAIENIDIIVSPTQRYYLIECSFVTSSFLIDEVIRILVDGKEIDVINVGAVDIEIDVCGNAYKIYDKVNISGCIQTGIGYVKSISNGPIEEINISKSGLGYSVGDKITAFNGFYAYISSVDENGGILEIKIKNGGYKYKEYPPLNIMSVGTGAIIHPYGKNVGGVKSIAFENPYALCNNSIISINSSLGYGFIGNVKLSSHVKINKWTDKKGFLGINSIVQDSDDNHEYSYHIISNVPSSKYIDVVDKLTHPYGFIRVPIQQINIDMDFMLSNNVSEIKGISEKDQILDSDITNLPKVIEIGSVKELNVTITKETITTQII